MEILLIWIFFMLLFLTLGYILGARGKRETGSSAIFAEDEFAEKLERARENLARFEQDVTPVLAVTGHEAHGGAVVFEGKLRTDPRSALSQLTRAFAAENFTPILQESETDGRVKVALVPAVGPLAQTPTTERPRWGGHLLLFVLTLMTTTWAGALHAGVNLLEEPGRFAVGLPYSLGLILILAAHELGHYFAARHHGIRVTPPYFIPVPFALGTFGAFIKLKSLSPDRRAAFDVAVAGPLAGLVFAIPALLVGLHYSRIVIGNPTPDMLHTGVQIGSSFLMATLAKIAFGAYAGQGQQLIMHPLAFAGWLGLIVTALNLLPIGQLDGGHMAHALFGARRGHAISVGGLITLFALALFVWPGLMMWAVIVWFIAGTRDAPPLNDVTPLDPGRRALGWFAFALLAAILIPVPHALYPSFGIHSPYL
jgi:membrane-associated protease RseP (regulator of RpoE activity)